MAEVPVWCDQKIGLSEPVCLTNSKPIEIAGVKYLVSVRLHPEYYTHRPQGSVVFRRFYEDTTNAQ